MTEYSYLHESNGMNIRTALLSSIHELQSHGFPTPNLDAEILLSYCLSVDRSYLWAHTEKMLPDDVLRYYELLIQKRLANEPIAYIVGRKEFWSLPFTVNKHVLIPRPETELLVEAVLSTLKASKSSEPSILEIGTGSGVISVALASELENVRIVATDICQDALLVAVKNADDNGVSQKISFCQGNLFENVSEEFDIIVSNPPYIPEGEFEDLPAGVRFFEPKLALVAGVAGTEYHRELIMKGADFLKEGGSLFMEIGANQKNQIIDIFGQSNFYDNIRFLMDYNGKDRVCSGRRRKA